MFSMDIFPSLVVAETHEPSFAKVVTEYVISAFHLATVIFVFKRLKNSVGVQKNYLATACFLIMLAELIFTLYKNVYDFDALLGHIFKVSGYCYLLIAVYLSTIKKYYSRLAESEKKVKQTNIWLSTLITNLNSGILVLNETNKEVLINDKFREMFQKDDSESLQNHLAAGDLPSQVNEIQKGKRMVVDQVIELSDGRVLEFDYIPTYVEEIFQGSLLKFTDVTFKRKLSLEIIRAKEEAEKASHFKTEFLSKLSHELRIPLNNIIGYAQILDLEKSESLSELEENSIQRILSSGFHLIEIVNNILDLSKIEAGVIFLDKKEINPFQIMKDCLKELRPLIMEKEIKVHLQLQEEKWNGTKIVGDPLRLKQVFLNVLQNGIKYNKKSGDLTVYTDKKDRWLVFRIEDTGNGILPEDLPNIFSPFYRSAAHRNRIEGTGIGLSISKQLLELMEGDIYASSVEGEGSSFTIRLPIENRDLN
ncbi:PAS domain-containing sensor histidine kinase [Paenibacillus physcomitrellae]|uniref:histidine kinase n=1 Tax=Paenibacillus physcomitrellae TaxID=1619311 RepID=A0ABQ1FQD1_9BACL|nr:PAS domain-containing sensor histidine kinase [Paenibacillus physcomitrellae]